MCAIDVRDKIHNLHSLGSHTRTVSKLVPNGTELSILTKVKIKF